MANSITAEELKRLQEIERKQKERYKKQNEHTNKLYDRVSFTVPKGRKEDIEAAAKARNVSVNKFISEIILGILDNNVVIKEVINNSIKINQNIETKPESEETIKSAKWKKGSEIKANTAIKNQEKTPEEMNAELQALIAKKKAEQERIEAKNERKKQRESEELSNGIRKLQQGQKDRRENELAKDAEKFEQFSEDKIRALLGDEDFRSRVSDPACEDDFIRNYGICNYERIQKCLLEIGKAEKEAAREMIALREACLF